MLNAVRSIAGPTVKARCTSATGFSELAGRSHAEFNGMAQAENYARAAAMVFFLIDHDDGKRWLQQTLGHYAQHPCAPFYHHNSLRPIPVVWWW